MAEKPTGYDVEPATPATKRPWTWWLIVALAVIAIVVVCRP